MNAFQWGIHILIFVILKKCYCYRAVHFVSSFYMDAIYDDTVESSTKLV